MRCLFLISISVMLGLVGCMKKDKPNNDLPGIGDHPPKGAIPTNHYVNLGDDDSLQTYKYSWNGSRFFLEVASDNTIRVILTNDTTFITPEGIKVGDKSNKVERWNTLKNPLGSKVYIVELPSGWKAQLMAGGSLNIGENIISSYPQDTIITFLSKGS
jgi:hypothetical protein